MNCTLAIIINYKSRGLIFLHRAIEIKKVLNELRNRKFSIRLLEQYKILDISTYKY